MSTKKKKSSSNIDTVITDIQAKLPKKDPTLAQFSTLFLETITKKFLLTTPIQDLSHWVQSQHKVFMTYQNNQTPHIQIQPAHKTIPFLKDRYSIEMTSRDMPHILITIEQVLRQHNIKLTRRIHPIIGIKRHKNGRIKSLCSPTETKERISHIYINFESTNTIQTASLLKILKFHINAVKITHLDQNSILSQLNHIKQRISKQKTNTTNKEWIQLINWLQNLNFTFLGYGHYQHHPETSLTWCPEHGLGILSPQFKSQFPALLPSLTTHTKTHQSKPLTFDAIPISSPVQRFDKLMRLSIHVPLKNGCITEHIFLGILKQSSLLAKNIETPLIHLKMKHIFKTKHMVAGSYDFNEVIRIFTAIPKFELFRASKKRLLTMVEQLLSITDINKPHCFINQMSTQNRLFLLIVLPTPNFTLNTIAKVQHYIQTEIPSNEFECVQIQSRDKCRLHLYLTPKKGIIIPSETQIESDLINIIQTWEDQLKQRLQAHFNKAKGLSLYNKYIKLIPKHYTNRNHPKEIVSDIKHLEALTARNPFNFNLYPFNYPETSELAGKATLLRVYSKHKIDLITIMPILKNLKLHVIDQLTARIGNHTTNSGFIQSFRVTSEKEQQLDQNKTTPLIKEIMNQIMKKKIEDDPLNGLTLTANLNWKIITLAQTYRNILLQLNCPYSSEKITATLCHHPTVTNAIFEFFDTKFNPSNDTSIKARKKIIETKIKPGIKTLLKTVQTVSEDAIFRRFTNLVDATVRTNYYQTHTHPIAIKLNSSVIIEQPKPTPYREIYVHGPNVEGTHIRMGSISRGGLRWSTRDEDFRTEILGLVKTQQTKNVVIVPEGSKGGFIIKTKTKTPAILQQQYQLFIQSLLDITDNFNQNNTVIPPKQCICYDPEDPYLVVAADKGTTTFSDLANKIAQKNKFWLGDAFASGGSHGYDHKKVGITAKGAWECTKLHFKELNWSEQKIKTAIGIGDMSGDVFGNGFLLSKKVKLLAAFNHLHIFIDPNPSPSKSWSERKRLFNLNGSTWKSYHSRLISNGGGVFKRSAKEITLTPEMTELLNTKKPVISGEEFIQLILKMAVDFIWFGGIGTYIKSAQESHLSVGDPANNAVRINAEDCQAKIISEGANLGLTPRARIEYSLKKGRINTDAIDNSSGVNMSDYEVNLKILLQQLQQKGVISSETKRNTLLDAATDEITTLVLRNNQAQHQLISLDEYRSKKHMSQFMDLIPFLETRVLLDTTSEKIPTQKELEALKQKENPMPRPVIAILQSYVKMYLYKTLIESNCIDQPHYIPQYEAYFPTEIRTQFQSHLKIHPLQREITCMVLVNQYVNQAGSTALHQLLQETGCETEDVINTYFILNTLIQGEKIKQKIEKSPLSQDQNSIALRYIESILHNTCRDLLQSRKENLPTFNNIDQHKVILAHLYKNTPKKAHSLEWKKHGFSAPLCLELNQLKQLELFPEILTIHKRADHDLSFICNTVVTANQQFHFQWLEKTIRNYLPQTSWEKEHQSIILQRLYTFKLDLLLTIMQHHPTATKKVTVASITEALISYKEIITHYFQTITRLQKSKQQIDLTSLTVTVNRLQSFHHNNIFHD